MDIHTCKHCQKFVIRWPKDASLDEDIELDFDLTYGDISEGEADHCPLCEQIVSGVTEQLPDFVLPGINDLERMFGEILIRFPSLLLCFRSGLREPLSVFYNLYSGPGKSSGPVYCTF